MLVSNNFSGKIACFVFLWSFIILINQNVSSEPIKFYTCSMAENTTSRCNITRVEIDPCPEALENEVCNLYKGTNTTMSTTFIPDFSAQNLKTQTYSSTLIADLPDIEHDRDGCKHSTCPVEAGKPHTISYTRYIRESYPSGTYLVKWRIWNEKDEECCYLMSVNIV